MANQLVAECRDALADPSQLAPLRKRLGLSPTMDHELARNAELFDNPAYPAYQIYTGVLFAAADFAGLSAAQRRTANGRVRIASALFGLVSLNDRIPPYRLNAEASMSGLGTLKSSWRKELDQTMPQIRAGRELPGGLVVDMRSGSYVSMWPLPKELGADKKAITVKVWQRGPGNTKTAVSHFNKATKGELAQLLATVTPAPRTFEELMTVCTTNGWDVQLNLAAKPQLDVIIRP